MTTPETTTRFCGNCRTEVTPDGKCSNKDCKHYNTYVIGTGRCVTCDAKLPEGDNPICQNPACVVSPNYVDGGPPEGGWPAEQVDEDPPSPPATPPVATGFDPERFDLCPYCKGLVAKSDGVCNNPDCPGKFPEEPSGDKLRMALGATARRVVAFDGATEAGDYSVKVIARQDPDGSITIEDVQVHPSGSSNDRIEAVQAERGAAYGDSTFGHANLGLLWTALLQNHYGTELDHPIPASVVLTMLVAHKCNRMVLAGLQTDNFLDCASYADLAEKARMQETGIHPAKGDRHE